jgi:AdoMet-dependent heme synthase
VASPDLRIRKEPFGYTLAFRSGTIGFYSDDVAPALLRGATESELDRYRVHDIPITSGFHLIAPLIVWFEITRDCNLPCRHCYIEAGPGRPREHELSTAEVLDVIDQLSVAGVFAVVLVGGEPMRRPDFLTIVRHAHERGLVLSIATNGTYLTQEVIDALPREECIVSVSVDGTSLHHELRVTMDFAQVRDKLLLLKRNNYPAAVMATQTNDNLEELEEVFAFAREHGFFFGSTPFSPIGRGRFFPQYVPQEPLAPRAAELYMRDKLHDNEMMERVGLCVAKFLDQCHVVARAARREFCGVAMAYITSDGAVYPCSICASRHSFRAASLRERSFSDIWANAFDAIRDVTFDSFRDCVNCELSREPYYCTSRCPVTAELYTGDSAGCGSTPYVKASLKRRTELLIEHGYDLGTT